MAGGVTFRWLERGIRVSPCDKCHRRVWPDKPRLQVHDGKGPMRKRGKGSQSSYWCEQCARKAGLVAPKFVEKPIEGTLF